MPKNRYFNFTTDNREQKLFSDIKNETINIFGDNLYYIRRNSGDYDNITNQILGQDPFQNFTEATLLCLYPENIDGFEGNREMLSKFGFNLEENMNFLIHQNEFALTGYNRPEAGDLLYWPTVNRLFKIVFIDYDYQFNQLGQNCVWQLQTNLFKYSSETIDTKIEEIDVFQDFENVDSLENDPSNPDNENLEDSGDALITETTLSSVN